MKAILIEAVKIMVMILAARISLTFLFQLPLPVAVHCEHSPQEESTLSQRGDVEVSSGGAAAAGPSRMVFPFL